MVAWNVGVNAAEAACSTKINTYTSQIWETNGSNSATAARTRSSVTRRVRRGRRSANAAATGATPTYAIILMARAVPSTIPAFSPASSKASRPSATVASPVPIKAITCAANRWR